MEMDSTEHHFSPWKPMFSGTDTVFVSASQNQHPRRLTIRLQFPPDAPCGLVNNADGTSTVRPNLDPAKRMQILRAVLSDNLHLPQKPTTERRCAVDGDGHCVKAKQPQAKPYSSQQWGNGSGLEMKLEATKRKLHQHYEAIDDHKRRKRIKLVDIRDVPIPILPQKPIANIRPRPVRVMIKRK